MGTFNEEVLALQFYHIPNRSGIALLARDDNSQGYRKENGRLQRRDSKKNERRLKSSMKTMCGLVVVAQTCIVRWDDFLFY